VQHQQTNLLFETVHKNTPKAPALNASTKPLSLPTYVFTLWHEHPIKHVQPWLDPLPKLLTRGHCSSEPSAQKQIIIDYKDDMSKWFSKTIAAMLDSSTASLRFPPAGSPDYHFLRQHFNTRKIAESGDENSSSGEPWILDQGYWFEKATEFFILTVHHAKFGLFPSKSKTNYRPSVHAAWSAEDSQLVSFVTALFGIRAKERNETFPSCKSVNHYFTLAKKLFDWNVHMYAFIEPFYINQLYQERSKRGLMHCTVILPTYLEQSRFWPSMTRISELYSCKRVPQGFCPNKDTGLYVFSQATKYDCLQRALNLNTFQSQSMFWIDFGIHHVVRPPNSSYERLLQQLGRSQYIRETHLRGLQPKEIANKQQFFGRLQQAVGGGLIGGPHALVQWLIHEFEREFTDALEWYPVLDEAILGSLALQYPDKILPIHSGHAEMFELRSVRCCLRLMKEAYGAKNWKRVYDIGLELPCGEHEVALYLDNADCELRKALLLDVCKKLYQITKDTHYKNEERGFL
jgi:hypothetical protein